jgi:FkbM family methyltransferase
MSEVEQILDRITDRPKLTGPFVLFGAGHFGRETLKLLRANGIEPVAFSDNDTEKWGTTIDGLDVESPVAAACRYDHATFVVTIYGGLPVREQLKDMGLKAVGVASLDVRHGAIDAPAKLLPHREDIMRAADIWADERSRKEYVAQIQFRAIRFDSLLPHDDPKDIYFPVDLFRLTDDETFVDCGAYDGDTVKSFLGRVNDHRRIVAIEPDEKSFEKLLAFSVPKLSTCGCILGERDGMEVFEGNGTECSRVSDDGQWQPCDTLDNILEPFVPPTIIKMDIEGSELAALKGGAETIRKHKPILAVCLYHRPEDLWTIPLYVRSLCPDYSLYLRRYSDDCWEQVLYAVPPHRVLGTASVTHFYLCPGCQKNFNSVREWSAKCPHCGTVVIRETVA